MADTTKQKIQQVLSDLIDRYGRVFWYDDGGQMQLFATSLDFPGVEVLTLQDNAFSLKYRILKGEQPERAQNSALRYIQTLLTLRLRRWG